MFADPADARAMIDWTREHRTPAAEDNPYLAWQETLSQHIIAALDGWRDARDALAEQTFFAIYGSPVLQTAVGVDPGGAHPLRKPGKNPLYVYGYGSYGYSLPLGFGSNRLSLLDPATLLAAVWPETETR